MPKNLSARCRSSTHTDKRDAKKIHILINKRIPKLADGVTVVAVYKDECTYQFRTKVDKGGLGR